MTGFRYERTVTVSAASLNGVATTQTPSGSGNLTLTSTTVALPNTGQRPQIVTLANLSNRTFTFTGTEYGTNRPMTYAMTGPNATTGIAGVSFGTLTDVAISGAAAGALTVGWAAQADTPPWYMDYRIAPTDISFQCIIVSGSPTYTARFTMDLPDGDGSSYNPTTYNPGTAKWWDHPIVASQTADNTGNYGKPIVAQSFYISGASTMRFTTWQGMGVGSG